MADHLWSADGAGGKEQPFGRSSIKIGIGHRRDNRPTRHLQRNINQGAKVGIGIDDHRIDLGVGNDCRHLRGRHIGRKKCQAPRRCRRAQSTSARPSAGCGSRRGLIGRIDWPALRRARSLLPERRARRSPRGPKDNARWRRRRASSHSRREPASEPGGFVNIRMPPTGVFPRLFARGI